MGLNTPKRCGNNLLTRQTTSWKVFKFPGSSPPTKPTTLGANYCNLIVRFPLLGPRPPPPKIGHENPHVTYLLFSFTCEWHVNFCVHDFTRESRTKKSNFANFQIFKFEDSHVIYLLFEFSNFEFGFTRKWCVNSEIQKFTRHLLVIWIFKIPHSDLHVNDM